MAGSTNCTCGAMKAFTSALDPAQLQKSAVVALSRSLPVDPIAVANRISGVRDSALKQGQIALIAAADAQDKFENLPEVVKRNPEVVKLGEKISAHKQDLLQKSAAVRTLGQELTDIDGQRDKLLSKKSFIEENVRAQIPTDPKQLAIQQAQLQVGKHVPGEVMALKDNPMAAKDFAAEQAKSQARKNTTFKSFEAYYDQGKTIKANPLAAKDLALAKSAQLSDAEKYYQQGMALKDTQLSTELVQGQLKQIPEYQSLESNLGKLNDTYDSTQSKYDLASMALTVGAKQFLGVDLPPISKSLDMLKGQYTLLKDSPAKFALAQLPISDIQAQYDLAKNDPKAFAMSVSPVAGVQSKIAGFQEDPLKSSLNLVGIPTDPLGIAILSIRAGIGVVSTGIAIGGAVKAYHDLKNLKFPAMPALPATPGSPAIPELPALPTVTAVKEKFREEEMDFMEFDGDLPAMPAMPQMPAFSGVQMGELLPQEVQGDFDEFMRSDKVAAAQRAGERFGEGIEMTDVAQYVGDKTGATKSITEARSALEERMGRLSTPGLPACVVGAREALPELPATPALTTKGWKVPTRGTLKKFPEKFNPQEYEMYDAILTQYEAKAAAIQRSQLAAQEKSAEFHSAVGDFAKEQKEAALAKMPSRSLAGLKLGGFTAASAVGAVGTGLSVAQLVQAKFASASSGVASLASSSSMPCTACLGAGLGALCPDPSNPTKVDVAGFFAKPKEFLSSSAASFIAVGESSKEYVTAHVENLKARVEEAGGVVASISSADLKEAIKSPKNMLALEQRLSGVALVEANVENLSPQESALLANVLERVDAPKIVTTPPAMHIATDPGVDAALTMNLAPGGSTVNAAQSEETFAVLAQTANTPDLLPSEPQVGEALKAFKIRTKA